jgi:hypothetical protein
MFFLVDFADLSLATEASTLQSIHSNASICEHVRLDNADVT